MQFGGMRFAGILHVKVNALRALSVYCGSFPRTEILVPLPVECAEPPMGRCRDALEAVTATV